MKCLSLPQVLESLPLKYLYLRGRLYYFLLEGKHLENSQLLYEVKLDDELDLIIIII